MATLDAMQKRPVPVKRPGMQHHFDPVVAPAPVRLFEAGQWHAGDGAAS